MDTTTTITNTIVAAEGAGVKNVFTADIFWDMLSKLLAYIPTVIIAFLLLFVGMKLVKFAIKLLGKLLRKRQIEETVISFVQNITNIGLKVLVILTFIGVLGIPTSSFIAAIGAAGLAVGLALQGSLQNFAGGVIILMLRPYRVGDLIEFGGAKGTVVAINIFNTVIEKPTTNENVIIPNGTVAASSLINWKQDRNRRVESSFGIAYGEDIAKARAVVLEMASKDDRVLKDIPTEVIVKSLGDSSVNLELRVWVKPDDYFPVCSDMLERIYNTLNENNINIPFPQLDVMIKK